MKVRRYDRPGFRAYLRFRSRLHRVWTDLGLWPVLSEWGSVE